MSKDDDCGSVRPTRNPERTRTALLAAAAESISERGTGVSLDHIAKRAGVTKGGLMHHFSTKDALIAALVEDAQKRLRNDVLAHLDLSENKAGKFLRAYVRALTSGTEEMMRHFTAAPTWAGVYDIPEVAQSAEAEEKWWMENLAADGLPEQRIRIIRRAAEGIAAAVAYGEETPQAAREAGLALIRLTNTGRLD